MTKNHPTLTDKNLIRARKIMFDVIDFLEKERINYHLEGGTLLGIVRDGDLLPWDHDIDLSIPLKDAELFVQNKIKLLFKGYRVTKGKIHKDIGGFKKGEYRIFKVKKFWPSIFKGVFPILNKHMIVADIFVKADDATHTYWQAMEKIMCVNKIYYSAFETVDYMDRQLRIPYKYKEYLTEKYGDWSTPVKNWNCGSDEKTVIGDAN